MGLELVRQDPDEEASAQLALDLKLPPEVEERVAPRAERIRNLVNVARGCIIEIGRELIAASGEVPDGQWEAWLKREFGWAPQTARNYIHVSSSFQSPTVRDWSDIKIDARALYLLARPKVPPEIRSEAVELAQEGKHITEADAERMIAERVVEALDEARRAAAARQDLLETERAELRDERDALSQRVGELRENTEILVSEATRSLAEHCAKLTEKIVEIEQQRRNPTAADVIDVVCKMIGKTRLSEREIQGIALATGKCIEYGGKIIPPSKPEESRQAEAALRLSSDFERALTFFARPIGDPRQTFDACPDYLRRAAELGLPDVIIWAKRFLDIMKAEVS
jgi:hypothetical protein